MRVGEIFGEGCFKTANDYGQAAMIYQHGEVPDHYYQAFIWSNKAVELGDEHQKHWVALTIDRYLVSIGKKQLFGSQAYASEETGWCFCMQQVEPSFPESMRQAYLGQSLDEQYAWISSLNQGEEHCGPLDCKENLQPTLRGSVLGFW